MAVTLTYLPQFAGVQIDADQLGDAPAALVERSTNNGLSWTTVRGGAEWPVSSGTFVDPLVDYEFEPGVVNLYRVTALPAGLYLTGVGTDYADTPDTAALDITGDLELRIDVTLSNWAQAAALMTKQHESSDLSYGLGLTSNGTIYLDWTEDGTAGTYLQAESTEAVSPDSSGRLALRATLDVDNNGDWLVTFYTAETIRGPWTQLGDPVQGSGTTNVHAGSAPLEIGVYDGGSDPLEGVVHAAEVHDGINTNNVVANPQFGAQQHLATSFTDDAGLTWTVQGNAQILTSQQASITPVIEAVWLKSVTRPFLNRPVCVVQPRDMAVNMPARNSIHQILGRSRAVAITDVRTGRNWTMFLRTENQVDTTTMRYVFESGDVLLIQVPPGWPIPGGYVVAGDVQETWHPLRPERVTWVVPVTQVAPPGPHVKAAIATWQSVLSQFASWDDVVASFSSWQDLLDTLIGDPSEVVVP